MDTPRLNQKEIFVIETGSDDDSKQYMVYAPFAGVFYQLSESETDRLENSEKHPDDKALQSVVKALTDRSAKELLSIKTLPEMAELNISLNQICNFSCSYCYAAQGHSNKVIDKEKLFSALSFFIDRNRTSVNKIRLTFSGGGDPLMSFSLLKEAMDFSEKTAKKNGFEIGYGIVTNGTLFNADFIDWVKHYRIDLVVSFDVLEDVQNQQRGRYKEVCDGINFLIENGIYPGIRSTITSLNVNRMEEMALEMVTKFPALGGIAFEPVLNPSLFRHVSDLEKFYDHFIEHYFASETLGLHHNFSVGNTIVNNTEVCKERDCLGKFTLTPEGEITACSRICSSKDDYYDRFHYGTIGNAGDIMIDTDKLRQIMQNNVYAYPECSSCIAKWHCSGGCLLARYAYRKDYFDCYCKFIRKMTVRSLLNNKL